MILLVALLGTPSPLGGSTMLFSWVGFGGSLEKEKGQQYIVNKQVSVMLLLQLSAMHAVHWPQKLQMQLFIVTLYFVIKYFIIL